MAGTALIAVTPSTPASTAALTASLMLMPALTNTGTSTRLCNAGAKKPSKLHEKEARVADGYHVFVATMPDSRMDGDPREVAEFYRIR